MTEPTQATRAGDQRPMAVNGGSPRVTVAFPFSKIIIKEPDRTLAELAGIVAELAEALTDPRPGSDGRAARRQLVEAAQRLADRLEAPHLADPAAPHPRTAAASRRDASLGPTVS